VGVAIGAAVLLVLAGASIVTRAGSMSWLPGLAAAGQDGQTMELAQRLLEGDLVVGRLPDDVRGELPLPPRASVLGGLDWTRGTKGSGTRVVLDAPGAAADVVAFYVRELPPRGWTVDVVRSGPETGTPPTNAGAGFCRNGGRWLFVEVSTRPSGMNDVRLAVENPYPPRPCTARPTPLPGGIYIATPTPTFRP
jgi:hypothetical protein